MTNGGEWGSFTAVSIVLAELTGLREDALRKPRRNPKRRGELAEAAFLLKVQSMGFRMARPWETATATILSWIPSEGGCGRCSLSRPRFCIRGGTKCSRFMGLMGEARAGIRLMTSMFWWCESGRLTLGMCGRLRLWLWRRTCGSIRTLNANARGGRVIGRLGG